MAYLLEKRSSALPIPKKKRNMTMVIFLLASVERAVEMVIAYLPIKKRSALLLLSSVKSCGYGRDRSSNTEKVCPSLHSFLSREL